MRHSATILLNKLLPQLERVTCFVTNLSAVWNPDTEALLHILMSGDVSDK
jgi:hypothetical protein